MKSGDVLLNFYFFVSNLIKLEEELSELLVKEITNEIRDCASNIKTGLSVKQYMHLFHYLRAKCEDTRID